MRVVTKESVQTEYYALRDLGLKISGTLFRRMLFLDNLLSEIEAQEFKSVMDDYDPSGKIGFYI